MESHNKNILLKVALDAIRAAIKKRTPPIPRTDDEELNERCGCFVTLKNTGTLRGCIGQFTSSKPLIETVSDMAVAASTKDPRFLLDPISESEVEFLEIEISVLSQLKRNENPLTLRLGIDGVYITDGHKTGCFLPQVASETGWTEEQFLTHCCVQKAGLPPDAWQSPRVQVYTFTADVFSARTVDIL